MADNPDAFEAYFKSDLHARRMADASKRTAERLAAIGGQGDLLPAFSEAIGTLFGVGHFYRHLGLKHQAANVFREVFKWLKTGTD